MLLCDPDRVIFIGYKRKKIEKSVNVYRDILSKRGRCPELTCRIILKNDLMQIIDALELIVIERGECIQQKLLFSIQSDGLACNRR